MKDDRFSEAASAILELDDDDLEGALLDLDFGQASSGQESLDLRVVAAWESGLRDFIAAEGAEREDLLRPITMEAGHLVAGGWLAAATLSSIDELRRDPRWAGRGGLLDTMRARAVAAGFPAPEAA